MALRKHILPKCQVVGDLGFDEIEFKVHQKLASFIIHVVQCFYNMFPSEYLLQNGSVGANCVEAGGHYNPNNMNHGSLTSQQRYRVSQVQGSPRECSPI